MMGDQQWTLNAEPAMRSAKALHYLQELAEHLDTNADNDPFTLELLRSGNAKQQAKRNGESPTG